MNSNSGRGNGAGGGSYRPFNQAELTAVFRRLGARDPEGWARSQIVEGINQLARFLFLRQAWGLVVDESDAGWIERHIKRAEAKPREPYAGVGLALKALRARGAEGDEILDLVRGVQAELLFNLCYLLTKAAISKPRRSAWSGD
jgi:beta-phosphoglucomutase-like phosphatase (HAD superfamily)